MATVDSVLGARLKRHFAGAATSSQWTDASGVSNATQATSARQPSIVSMADGMPAVSFSSNGSFGANADYFSAPAAGASATPRYTLICGTCKIDPAYGNDGNGCVLAQIGANCIIYLYPGLDNALRAAGWSNTAFAWGASGINDGNWHTWTATWDSTTATVRLYIDGTLQAGFSTGTGSGINLSTQAIFFGATDTSGNAALQGIVGDVGIAQDTSAFTTTDISNLHAALSAHFVATTGSTSFSVTGSGTLRGTGALSGSSSFAVTSSSATLSGKGALTGTSAFGLTATGDLTNAGSPAGDITGSTSFGLTAVGSLGGLGSITGAASFAVSSSATLSAKGTLTGSATLGATASASITGKTALTGTSSLSVTASGSLLGKTALTGSSTFGLTSSGSITGKGTLQGTASISFSSSATLTGKGALTGTSTFGLTAVANTGGLVSITGTASFGLGASGTLTGRGDVQGAASWTITSTGNVAGRGALSGTTTIGLSALAAIQATAALSGLGTISLSATGTLTDGIPVLVPVLSLSTKVSNGIQLGTRVSNGIKVRARVR